MEVSVVKYGSFSGNIWKEHRGEKWLEKSIK